MLYSRLARGDLQHETSGMISDPGSNRSFPILSAGSIKPRSAGMYPEEFVTPMREELTSVGFRELRTPQEVDEALGASHGTTLVVVNSICGCAAGKARPGVVQAINHRAHPDFLTTVF